MTGFKRDGDDDPADGGLAVTRQATVDPDDEYSVEALGAWPRWRRSRPFWGGLLVLLAAAEMLLSERAPLPVVIHVGMQGLAGYLVPTILLLCGLLILFSPAQRAFYSILAVLLSLGSWITSNLGGFFVGMLLGVLGGSLSFAWTRLSDSAPAPQLQAATLPEQPAGLDLILGDPDENSSAEKEPAGPQGLQERPEDEDARPIEDQPAVLDEPPIRIDVPSPDEPPIRIDVPAPDEPQLRQDAEASDGSAGDQKPGDPDLPAPDQTKQTPPGSGPGARRGWPAGPLGSACL